MNFYNILAVTKANLMDSTTDLASTRISENEITDQRQKAFSKALFSEQDRNASRITTLYDQKVIVTLVSSINAKDLLKKFDEFKNQNRIADLDGIKDAIDKLLKTSEKNLDNRSKEVRAATSTVVVVVPGAVKEIE
ncbi:hypothetical protein [Rickettsia australis]|uniref:Uncharacterized protein n=1 Tax=Rickettsia australis (strain Cutlack) TaxID=1105110 RepID=H8K8I5_RICAC|nr:hypothetical protein [Rickettsia australis]AFC71578.1 hypothetical protein MC5_06700 [Rickettsia australis str. Cutlack]